MDFQKNVIERSHEIPVVVDFWAEWCGPCRVLGPVIENLAAKAGGRWELVKVNADHYPELSQQFQVRGIPSVKMFNKGKVIADFTGALPQHEIEKWLDEHIPDGRKVELDHLLQGLETGQKNLQELQAFCNTYPDMKEARLEWAFRSFFSKPHESIEMVSNILLGDPLYTKADNVRQLARLFEQQTTGGSAIEKDLNEAAISIQKNDWGSAFEHIIHAVIIDKKFNNELPRKAGIALFSLLGEDHEISKKYRRKFDMALF